MMKIISRLAIIVLLMTVILTNNIGQPAVKIMPLGNSMTEGWTDGSLSDGQMVAYRKVLKELLTNAGYNIDFVGTENKGCAEFADCECAGIGGSRDQYIVTLLQTGYDEKLSRQLTAGPYLDAFNPDVILLGIGTNDLTHETDAITNNKVSQILDQIDAYEARADKDVIVFLSLIINRRRNPDGSEVVNTYSTSLWNTTINTMAQQRIANGDLIFVVDLEKGAGINYGYSAGDMCGTDPEGLHPSAAGYTKIANKYYSTILANYNTAPVITSIPDASADEGSSFTIIHLDNVVFDVQDADQNLAWTITQIGTSNLDIVMDVNRNVTITPKNSEWSGTQTVVFNVTDLGKNGKFIKSTSDTVVFTVLAKNDPPVITNQSILTVNEDNSKTLNLTDFSILDPDSQPATFQLKVLPGTNYSVNGLVVTPASNYSGNLTVNVAVSDNLAQGPQYAALLKVEPVNDKPVYTGQPAIIIDEDQKYKVLVSTLTVSDADNLNSELTIVMGPGTDYTIKGDTVVPNENYYGTLQIPSSISDPGGAKSTDFYLTITVNSLNDPPLFTTTPEKEVKIGDSYIYAFDATDPDSDDQVTITVIQKPIWLTYYEPSKLLAGIPKSGNSGMQQIIISATDGQVTVDQSFILDVGQTAVIDYQSGQELALYPNPASNKISVSGLPAAANVSFKLFNIVGSLTYSREIKNNSEGIITVDDLNMLDGIYFYLIEVDSKLYSGKVSIVN